MRCLVGREGVEESDCLPLAIPESVDSLTDPFRIDLKTKEISNKFETIK